LLAAPDTDPPAEHFSVSWGSENLDDARIWQNGVFTCILTGFGLWRSGTPCGTLIAKMLKKPGPTDASVFISIPAGQKQPSVSILTTSANSMGGFMPKLIVKSTEFAPGEIELKPGINRFGRSPGSDHHLNHPAISELHCEIIVENSLVFVRDLASTNGTFIDQRQIRESALYAGQILQIGPVEMILDAEPARVAIPEMPAFKPEVTEPGMLADGYPACLNHLARHAVWECTFCARVYCDDCIRKIRRVGGAYLKFCPACNNSCEFSAWSEMVKKKKKSLLATLADKVKTSFKRTRLLWGPAPLSEKPPKEKPKRRKR
jgi:hypothetical protein